MKLYIKQRLFSWVDKFYIKNEYGTDVYYAQGEFFSWGRKLHIYDMSGIEAAFIHRKMFTWLPKYFIEINGNSVCELVKEIAFFRQSYRLEGLDWQLEGDFWAHEYSLSGRGHTLMSMSKHWFVWGDSYELDIADPAYELLCLCVALAVDCVTADAESSNN